ncbi:MAG: hypothetical protein H6581_00430 [Bacteroidia bacterium]|nr:hypothetical protein [Bacteroidia bacterium]
MQAGPGWSIEFSGSGNVTSTGNSTNVSYGINLDFIITYENKYYLCHSVLTRI